jgi:heme/copper-type cytochrome/quinol oxidase subunit 2
MHRQSKIQSKTMLLLILASWLVAIAGPCVHAASAADPQDPSKAFENVLEKAAKESLDLLRREAEQEQPDWMVAAKARASGWEFSVTYGKGKGLAQPSDAKPPPSALPLTDLVLPQDASVVMHVTSNDDMYPFVVPALNIKTDAIPGRLQSIAIDTKTLGAFPVSCGDPCDAQAQRMVFTIHVVDIDTFHRWRMAKDAATAAPTQP